MALVRGNVPAGHLCLLLITGVPGRVSLLISGVLYSVFADHWGLQEFPTNNYGPSEWPGNYWGS